MKKTKTVTVKMSKQEAATIAEALEKQAAPARDEALTMEKPEIQSTTLMHDVIALHNKVLVFDEHLQQLAHELGPIQAGPKV
jgi:hypothetical protein